MEKEIHRPDKAIPSEVDIEMIVLVKKLWIGRRTMLVSIFISIVFGLTIAFISPKQYTATSTIVPQIGGDSNSKLGGLGSLAALAGINLDIMSNQNGSDLSPIVYPQIVSSVPFQLELMNTPLNFEDFPLPVTLYDYLTKYQKPTILGILKKYTIGLPAILARSIIGMHKVGASSSYNNLNPLRLSEDQLTIETLLDNAVTLDVKAKDGYLSITVNLPEPLATAQMALKAQDLLQKYIIDFKTQKAQANLDFIESSYKKSKKEFEQAQVKLAVANDRGKGFTSGLPQVEIDRLQSDYTITFGVYQELAKQYEQAKIQVKKETPVFTIVEPPVVPIERTKPKRLVIVIVWLCLGLIFGIIRILGKEYSNEIRNKWKEINV